jgi:ankyrin repeat protein
MDLLQAVYTRKHDEVAAIRSRRELTLPEAAAVGDVTRVGRLLEAGTPVDERSPDGFTPLQLACHFDHEGAAALLVRAGADLTARATGSMTVQALHAAAASPTGACIPLLIAAGAPLDETQDGGFTPLHEVATRKLRPLVELLLAAGADPTIVADDGHDAAAMAEAGGDAELTALLSKNR